MSSVTKYCAAGNFREKNLSQISEKLDLKFRGSVLMLHYVCHAPKFAFAEKTFADGRNLTKIFEAIDTTSTTLLLF